MPGSSPIADTFSVLELSGLSVLESVAVEFCTELVEATCSEPEEESFAVCSAPLWVDMIVFLQAGQSSECTIRINKLTLVVPVIYT